MIELIIDGERRNFLFEVNNIIAISRASGHNPTILIVSQDIYDAIMSGMCGDLSYPAFGRPHFNILGLRLLIEPGPKPKYYVEII